MTELKMPVPIGSCFYKADKNLDGTPRIIESKVTGYRVGKNGITVQSTRFYSLPIEDLDDFELFTSLDSMENFYTSIGGADSLVALIREMRGA